MSGKRSKTQYIGLALIAIMFFSTIGFAVIQSVYNPTAQETQNPTQTSEPTIEKHTRRLLTNSEKSYLFRNGATILEFLYSSDCSKCIEYRPIIEGFSTKFSNIVLEDSPENSTLIQFLGKKTVRIENVTEKSLLDAYCEVTFTQPKDCVLKNF